MQIQMSKFLLDKKEILKKLIKNLSKDFNYVSILGTDTKGKQYAVQRTGINVNDSMWCERGFVVRIHNGINYSEFSFNEISNDTLLAIQEEITSKLKDDLNRLRDSSVHINGYPVVEEESITKSFLGNVSVMPYDVSPEEKINRLAAIKDKGLSMDEALIDVRVIYEEVHVSKIFISNNKDLEQSYIWGQAAIIPIARRENNTKFYYKSTSGLKGVELIDELESMLQEAVPTAVDLLNAKRVAPGEYDIICGPEISGLIAHEAFGHGVEMDMFVKNRAKAVEYLDKPVASELVTMHDGASAAQHVSSYLFDDEGTLGSDTIVIEKGILKTGISDLLSALKLGTNPTGNGKRQSFERKAYARMTNTFFASGEDNLEDMIASIEEGYLLEEFMSGMEDPKNWGIQCMIVRGKEIKNGKLTGKIVSPLIMTGYVPDVLKSISMVSQEVELSGAGACGKGYKELVKASDGGPYIKTRARLG